MAAQGQREGFSRKPRTRIGRGVGLVAGLATIAVLLFIVVLAPVWLVQHDTRPGGLRQLAPSDRVNAINDVRTTLLQALGGGVLLLGVYLTWRQVHVSREGQLTERYTRAVEQLGSHNRGVRVAAIYALERIARDSRADLATVTEVLTAFIREQSTWQQPEPQQPDRSDADELQDGGGDEAISLDRQQYLRFRVPDAQAALVVLGRMPRDPVVPRLELRNVDLRGSNLEGLDLRQARLCDAHLERARLVRTRLERADLRRACLRRANLEGVHLEDADLRETDLRGVHNLSKARLARAWASTETRWPAGFDPGDAGVLRVEPNVSKAPR
jgi:hypothetical protein